MEEVEEDRSLIEESLLDAQIDTVEVERREFAAESERLRAAARKLVEDAQRLQTEAIQLETEASKVLAKESEKSKVIYSLKCQKILHCLSRNDTETKDVHIDEYDAPVGQATLLGEALEGNTVVLELYLDIEMMLPKGSAVVSIPVVGKLLQFLSTSTSLRRVHLGLSLSGTRMSRAVAYELTGMLVDAIAKNSSIVDLSLNLPDQEHWLQKIANMPLTSLKLWFPDFLTRDVPTIASCIASLSHLEFLELFPRGHESVAIAILTQLSSADSRLRHLSLNSDDGMYEPLLTALGRFLSSTTRLDHLELSGLDCYENELEIVFRGLQHVNVETGVTTIYMSKLHFAEFQFDKEEFPPMVAFLKTRIHRKGAVTCRSALQELCFHPCGHDGLGRFGARQLASSLLMARMRMNDSGIGTKLMPTIGSQVRSISLGSVPRIFLDHLGRHAHRVRLETMELIDVPKDTGVALGACLPKLQYLKVLKLSFVGTGSPYWILRGLRRNGTLVNVEITYEEEYCHFDAAQSRLVEAYCERNRVLGDLLDNEAGLAQCMLSSLLQVAKQAPVTQVSNLVRGLLSLED
jgi:hypothetical protein